MHHIDYYLHMLEQLGLPVVRTNPRLALMPAERDWAVQRLGAGKWLAVNPGASYGSAKRWFPERFAAVADELSREYGYKVVLTGGRGESAIGRDIEQAMRCPPLNLIGSTSIRELMAILAHCRLVVTNDSGPMHVAAAFGAPIVAVFGPTDHAATSPAGDRCRIVCQQVDCAPCMLRECPIDHRCMERVSVSDVLAAARDLLDRSR